MALGRHGRFSVNSCGCWRGHRENEPPRELPTSLALFPSRRLFRPANHHRQVYSQTDRKGVADHQGGVSVTGFDVRNGGAAYADGVGEVLLRNASRESQPF